MNMTTLKISVILLYGWYATFSGNLEQNVKQLSILPKANTLIQNKSFGADCSIDKCFSSSPQITG
jgi:hypothetical protein